MMSEEEQIANLADRYVALSRDLQDIKSDILSEDKAFFERPRWSIMSTIVDYHTRYAAMWEEKYSVYKRIGYLTKDAHLVSKAILDAEVRSKIDLDKPEESDDNSRWTD